MKTGIELITEERERQISKEGWTPLHDEVEHYHKEIAEAAKDCLQSYINGPGSFAPLPWHDKWGLGLKHNRNPMRLLVISGALIAAEIDRLQRKANDEHE